MLKKTFKKQLIKVSIMFAILGLTLFAYQESWIIFMIPNKKNAIKLPTKTKPTEAVFYFWKHEKWGKEKISYITSPNPAETIQTIAHLYFRVLDDEEIIKNDVTVQSVVLHANKQIAFISCNQTPFDAQNNTRQKLMVIEGLLKTLRKNNIAVPSIQLLVNHQPLEDDHLDFTIPWPLQGYV